MEKIILYIFLIGAGIQVTDFSGTSNSSYEPNFNVTSPATTVFNLDTLKLCTDCHDKILVNESVHSPAKKDCQRCHVSNGLEHPLDNKLGFSLKQEVPGLCYECHDPKNEKEHVHDPAAKGKCLTCHSPHSSPELYLVTANPVSKLCLDCHDLNIPEDNLVHQAVSDGNCVACHNPHQAKNELFIKSSNTARLCGKCHKSIRKDLKLEHVHAPFKKDCFACHNGHSSKEAHLSDLTTKDLCISCHEGVHNSIQSASSVHQAINIQETCLNCHSPHSSVEKSILLINEKELCLSCHDKPIVTDTSKIISIGKLLKKGNVIHGTINENGCSVCHQPHASEQHTLLKSHFPERLYAPAEIDRFSLCFNCHDKTLFEAPENSETNFRNKDVNLHYMHIKGDKGRNCTLCHNVHGAVNAHLIEDKTIFGNWEMPINYKAFENGGSCAPGCHEEKKYIRYELPDSLKIGN